MGMARLKMRHARFSRININVLKRHKPCAERFPYAMMKEMKGETHVPAL